MKKIALLLLALSISLFSSDIKTKTGEFPAKEMKKQNQEIAKLAAKAISKGLPTVIDKYTTLVKVINEDTTLIWTFEINTGAKSNEAVRAEDHSRMQKAITQGICQSSNKFLKAGINTSYIYISAKSKAKLFRFDISQKDCVGI